VYKKNIVAVQEESSNVTNAHKEKKKVIHEVWWKLDSAFQSCILHHIIKQTGISGYI